MYIQFRAPSSFLRRSANAYRFGLTIAIAGFTTALIGGGMLHQRQQNGSYNAGGDSSLLQVIIGIVILVIGLSCVGGIYLYRSGACLWTIGYDNRMMDNVRAGRYAEDVELGNRTYIRPALMDPSNYTRPSFSSQAPILPEQPERVYLAPASLTDSADESRYEPGTMILPDVSTVSNSAGRLRSSTPRTLGLNLGHRSSALVGTFGGPLSFEERMDVEMSTLDPYTGRELHKRPNSVWM